MGLQKDLWEENVVRTKHECAPGKRVVPSPKSYSPALAGPSGDYWQPEAVEGRCSGMTLALVKAASAGAWGTPAEVAGVSLLAGELGKKPQKIGDAFYSSGADPWAKPTHRSLAHTGRANLGCALKSPAGSQQANEMMGGVVQQFWRVLQTLRQSPQDLSFQSLETLEAPAVSLQSFLKDGQPIMV